MMLTDVALWNKFLALTNYPSLTGQILLQVTGTRSLTSSEHTRASLVTLELWRE